MKLHYCQACGKVSVDRYGSQPLSVGWDESCMMNAVVIDPSEHWEALRSQIMWGTYGKDGKGPLEYVSLADMSTDHIRAVLSKCGHISRERRRLFTMELCYRLQ